MLKFFLLVLVVFHQLDAIDAAAAKDRLADIPALVFSQGRQTAFRRTSPVAQLTCEGEECRGFTAGTVRCVNAGRGANNGDPDWECKTDMPAGYQFGPVVVSCEGYDYPEDPFVLRDSCGLTYRLIYSPPSKASTTSAASGAPAASAATTATTTTTTTVETVDVHVHAPARQASTSVQAPDWWPLLVFVLLLLLVVWLYAVFCPVERAAVVHVAPGGPVVSSPVYVPATPTYVSTPPIIVSPIPAASGYHHHYHHPSTFVATPPPPVARTTVTTTTVRTGGSDASPPSYSSSSGSGSGSSGTAPMQSQTGFGTTKRR